MKTAADIFLWIFVIAAMIGTAFLIVMVIDLFFEVFFPITTERVKRFVKELFTRQV